MSRGGAGGGSRLTSVRREAMWTKWATISRQPAPPSSPSGTAPRETLCIIASGPCLPGYLMHQSRACSSIGTCCAITGTVVPWVPVGPFQRQSFPGYLPDHSRRRSLWVLAHHYNVKQFRVFMAHHLRSCWFPGYRAQDSSGQVFPENLSHVSCAQGSPGCQVHLSMH